MKDLLTFIKNIRVFLFFLTLQFIALSSFFSNHIYPKNVVYGTASKLLGNTLKKYSDLISYFDLKYQNKKLLHSIGNLYQQKNNLSNKIRLDNTNLNTNNNRFEFNYANIISGVTKNRNNFFTLDKGTKHKVEEGMGVVGINGIIGFIVHSNSNFSIVKTILSEDININAMVKRTNIHGLLKWDGKSSNVIQLNEITNDSDVKIGDTIVTRGSSGIFPRNFPVGVVKEIEPQDGSVYLLIHINLFENLNKSYHVFFIKDKKKDSLIKINKKIEVLNNE